ncbi:MAG: preprotein translocase subunit SecY [Micrococcaceae bacterium]
MLQALTRAFKTPDLRKRIFFTLGMIALFRLGSFIPTPGVNYTNVQQCLKQGSGSGGLQDMINMFSGGALLQLSVFALGIMPYITASIMVQLLRVVIPHFEALHEEGQTGQAKLTQYTRYLTIFLAVINATTIITLARSGNLLPGCSLPLIPNTSVWTILLMIVTLTAGTSLIMWMGEMVTEKGIGNGMSILIFTSVAAGFPTSLGAIRATHGWGVFALVLAVGVLLVALVIFVEQSQRRIPVQYAKRTMGSRTVGGGNTYIPIKVNMAGVVPVIFASSILMLPQMVAQFFTARNGGTTPAWAEWIDKYLVSGDHPLYMIIYFFLIIFFAYFYVSITFNPEEVADNMKKYGGFIPGIRAGRPTANYLAYVLNRITAPGSLYLALIALLPMVALALFGANKSFPFGGTSLLIIVGVGLDTVKQLNAKLQQHHYEGLLRDE